MLDPLRNDLDEPVRNGRALEIGDDRLHPGRSAGLDDAILNPHAHVQGRRVGDHGRPRGGCLPVDVVDGRFRQE